MKIVESKIKDMQKRKFDTLNAKKKTVAEDSKRGMVVNLKLKTLDEAMQSILAKSLNFTIARKVIPFKDGLPVGEGEEVRGEVCRELKVPPYPIMSRSKHRNPYRHCAVTGNSIIIFKSDQGNATVILDVSSYQEKIMAILQDEAFWIIKTDRTGRIE